LSAALTIRQFAPGDLARLHEIRRAAFAPVFASFREIVGEAIAPHAFAGEEEAQGRHLEELCSGGGDDSQVYVGLLDDRIAGFVSLTLDRGRQVGELELNAVDPALVGQGVGTALYCFALERMREAGMKVAVVGTGGDSSHAPARRAYAKAGFDQMLPTQWLYRTL
jgi:GNAT superfamily N-acetyltransferase